MPVILCDTVACSAHRHLTGAHGRPLSQQVSTLPAHSRSLLWVGSGGLLSPSRCFGRAQDCAAELPICERRGHGKFRLETAEPSQQELRVRRVAWQHEGSASLPATTACTGEQGERA